MKNKRIISILLISMAFFVFCDKVTAPVSSPDRELTTLEKKLVNSGNDFGLNLFRQISADTPTENIFISPLSISMALGMTLNGAAGETHQAMRTTLKFDDLNQQQINESYESLIELLRNLDPKVIFEIANSIWYRNSMTFKQNFIKQNQTYFDAAVQPLNFTDPASVNTINQWVKNKTRNKISKIVDQIDNNDIMFLINAIYFKGSWTYEFKKEDTRNAPFYHIDESVSTVQMMRQKGEFLYADGSNFQIIDLPYGGDGDYSMTIFLPHDQKEINGLVDNLTSVWYFSQLQQLSKQQGVVEIPKFKMEYKIKLNDILSMLGMGIAFDPDRADLTNLYEGPGNAYISQVLHKTFVEVNEEGTEAAAVTSVEVGVTSIGGGGFNFRADRPFLFVIHENKSNTIIFMGKILAPKSG